MLEVWRGAGKKTNLIRHGDCLWICGSQYVKWFSIYDAWNRTSPKTSLNCHCRMTLIFAIGFGNIRKR